jgi:predicted GH43/DUF377 family glycosyl hydrolase
MVVQGLSQPGDDLRVPERPEVAPERIRYEYHDAYMPDARVVERNGCYHLEVEGMSESVEVVRKA